MALTRRGWMAGAAALGALPAGAAFAAAAASPLRAAAREAWLYTLPLIEMAATRAGSLQPPGGPALAPNTFRHARGLSTPASRLVTSPNNDTLFSNAWIDLTAGPVTLTIPPTGQRYISVAVMNMYTDNDAVLGTRTVGGDGGRFTLVGPQEAGSGPDVVRLATPHGWILVRTLIDGEADLPAAHAVQDGLALAGPATPLPPAYANRHAGWADYFASAQRLLLSDPPPATDARILRRIAPLGLGGKGAFDPARFSAADAADIQAGCDDARTALIAGAEPPNPIQGWTYPRADVGNFGQDYAFRASVALVGLAALPNAEAMYMRPVVDAAGTIMDGDAAYRLSFAKGAFPPVDGFWSLTMYEVTPEKQAFLTENPLNRYSIGDRTPGLATNPDGSLDIWISRADPGGARRANWLPAPAKGPFRMTFRTYLPRSEIVNGAWRIPALQKA